MKLLFIGNSHTYYNDMPAMVGALLHAMGEKSHVTMLAHGGKTLRQHATDPAVLFNIRHGGYDAVIAQDNASQFERGTFTLGADSIRQLTDKAGVKLVLYMPPAPKELQRTALAMAESYLEYKEQTGVAVAPVGEVFTRMAALPDSPALYRADGAHATAFGSLVAALTIFYTLTGRKRPVPTEKLPDVGVPAEAYPAALAEACRAARLYNG